MQRALEKQRKQAQAELAEIKRQLENGEHVVSILQLYADVLCICRHYHGLAWHI